MEPSAPEEFQRGFADVDEDDPEPEPSGWPIARLYVPDMSSITGWSVVPVFRDIVVVVEERRSAGFDLTRGRKDR